MVVAEANDIGFGAPGACDGLLEQRRVDEIVGVYEGDEIAGGLVKRPISRCSEIGRASCRERV